MTRQKGFFFITYGLFVFGLVFAGVYTAAQHQNEQQQQAAADVHH